MGGGAVSLGKANAVTRQAVGIGGPAGMIGVHHIGALLVGHKDQDVGTAGRHDDFPLLLVKSWILGYNRAG